MSQLAYITERNDVVTIVIPGKPVPWRRAIPKYNSVGMWDSQKQLKLVWGITIRNQFQKEPYTGPIGMKLTFNFAMPKNRKKEWPTLAGTFHYIKPDNSNLTKFIEDACNELLYIDDCQIAQTWVEKRYSYEPSSIMEIYKL